MLENNASYLKISTFETVGVGKHLRPLSHEKVCVLYKLPLLYLFHHTPSFLIAAPDAV